MTKIQLTEEELRQIEVGRKVREQDREHLRKILLLWGIPIGIFVLVMLTLNRI